MARSTNPIRSGLALLAATLALAGCGGGAVDSGGLTASDWNDAQSAMNLLQRSNIPTQLVNLTATIGLPPAACRVHLESTHPKTFVVYVFWVPFVSSRAFTWMAMTIGSNTGKDAFHLGAEPVLPPAAASLTGSGTLVSQLGPRQTARNQAVMKAHAGDAFSKPGARCQVLRNGYLRLLPYA